MAKIYQLPAPLVTISADWLGGEPCFTGRRVAVRALFDYLKAGQTLGEFIGDFPSVSQEHAVAVIDLANRAVGLPDAAEWMPDRDPGFCLMPASRIG